MIAKNNSTTRNKIKPDVPKFKKLEIELPKAHTFDLRKWQQANVAALGDAHSKKDEINESIE